MIDTAGTHYKHIQKERGKNMAIAYNKERTEVTQHISIEEPKHGSLAHMTKYCHELKKSPK